MDPGQLGVLGVGVVVAQLGATQLVAVQQHRHALREQQGGDEVALLAGAQRPHLGVVGGAFGAGVPRPVVRFAVAVALAIGVVVLVVVGDQVLDREPVVRGDEVDRGHRSAAGVLVEVGRASDAGGEFAQRRRFATPEIPHGVAVFAVPFRPLRREVAHLVAARADVPGLGDELHLAHDRVLLHELEERGEFVHVVQVTGQRRGQVEAKPVHVHLGDPVPQRVHDQLQYVRVPHVEGVAGAGVVHVVLLVIVHQAVVRLVVDALERDGGAEVVALRGVVVHHVENHLDAGVVHAAHHALEFLHLLAEVPGGGVRVVRGEEPDGVVAPVVVQALLLQGAVVHELVYRHQLDRGHAEFLQVVDDRRMRHPGIRAPLRFGDLRLQLGQALHVRLVDEGLVVRGAQRPVAGPVEERVDHDAEHHVWGGVFVVA